MKCILLSVPTFLCCIAHLCGNVASAADTSLHPRKTVQLRGKTAGSLTDKHKSDGDGHDWTYSEPDWSDDFKHCGSAAQSPINIHFGDVTYGPKEERQQGLHKFMRYKPLTEREVINHGHNVQVNGLFGDLELPDGIYEVKEFHFHFPSEHAINGQLAAGEMQIVHQRKNATGNNELAVVGVLLQEPWVLGADSVAVADYDELVFFNQLGFGTTDLPKEGQEVKVEGRVDLHAFKKQFSGPFFHYYGSLTTPPCTRSVHWYVMQTPSIVTLEMIESFKAIFSSSGNNRPLQPLNGRAIQYSVIALPNEYEISTDEFAQHIEEEAQTFVNGVGTPGPAPAPEPEPEPGPEPVSSAEAAAEPAPSPAVVVPDGLQKADVEEEDVEFYLASDPFRAPEESPQI